MITLIQYLIGWCLGVIVLRMFVFDIMMEFIKDDIAVAILCILLITVYTLCFTVFMGVKKK